MSYLTYQGKMVSNGGKYTTGIIPYPASELTVLSLTALANYVNIATQYDTFGDSAAIIDFEVKINGTPATLTTLQDGFDSNIRINFTETVVPGNTVTISYVPNPARWIISPSPFRVLYAMNNLSVTNLT